MEGPRRISIYPTAGHEGKAVEKNAYAGKTIAVFTSGGDAQGTINLCYWSINSLSLNSIIMWARPECHGR